MNPTRVLIRSLRCAAVAALLAPLSASAIQINVDSLVANGGNTANVVNSTSGRHVEHRSQTSILDASGSNLDFLGANVDARIRYASITSTDTGSFSLGQVIAAKLGL